MLSTPLLPAIIQNILDPIDLNQQMDSMLNRWQKALQDANDITSSRFTASRKGEESSKNLKEPLSASELKDPKASLSIDDRNKDARTRSNEQKTGSRDNRMTSNKKVQTPNKKGDKRTKKEEKVIENSANAIMEMFSPTNPDKFRLRLRSLLENLLLQVGLEKNEPERTILGESTILRPAERAYNELEHRYFECQKQRQYLRGKLQMSAKRCQGLQRQIQRYGKIQKLIDQSISRQAQLKQQLSRAHLQNNLLEQTMRQQREMYEHEVSEIRELIGSLQRSLPID